MKKRKSQKYIACTADNNKYEFNNPQQLLVGKGKKASPVELSTDKNGFTYISWKNKKYLVEVLEKSQNQYTIGINGVSYQISVESPFSYKRRKFLAKNRKNPGIETITAPMPGKIVKFLVEENQEVKQGEPLLILESMKMQNEIISNMEGKISAIHYKPKDNVVKDDILIELVK